jgi:ABC-type branched-subunit amino acid transport system substrate-binding protein
LLAARKETRPVALLVPLTGGHAALGLSMQQAAMLPQSGAAPGKPMLRVFDTGGTPAGAAAAAGLALKAKAGMLLGPLTAAEVPAVVQAAAGRVPVLAFSNDLALRNSGAFLFGITASQSTQAILRYARTRGVRNVLVIGDGGSWSTASVDAAKAMEPELGITVRAVTVAPGTPLPAVGDAPDAVLVPGGGAALLAASRALRDAGVQLLTTFQGVDYRPEALAALEGAWIASPEPDAFERFAGAYAARNGGRPGAIAALAYDAVGITEQLRAANQLNREGLLGERGFDCATGAVRFRTDGSCARSFAILLAGRDGYSKVAVSQGA